MKVLAPNTLSVRVLMPLKHGMIMLTALLAQSLYADDPITSGC